MKHLAFAAVGLVLALGGFGCAAGGAAFGQARTFSVGETMTYDDGVSVTLTEIGDSRCPAGVQCIWEGELSPMLRVTGGDLAAGEDVRLGTSTARTASAAAYGFLLSDATETEAVITVSKP